MDFFNDDFGFESSPLPKTQKAMPKKSQTNKSIKGGDHLDELDDIMNQLLDKEKKKEKKPRQNQITSFASLVENPSPPRELNQTKKWDSYGDINIANKNNANDLGKTYQPIRNRQSSKSVYDDKGSEDNKSFKSGATGRVGGTVDNLDFLRVDEPKGNQFPFSTTSMRSQMKPPLRRRPQSKTQFEIGADKNFPQQNIPSLQDLQNANVMMRPPLPRKQPAMSKTSIQPATSLQKLQFSESFSKPNPSPQPPVAPQIQIQQKVVYIQKQPKNLRQQFDKQIKFIKQSHQKQITHLRQQLEREIKSNKEVKLKLMKQFEQQREKQRKLYENIHKKDEQKIKQMYQWELKRKSQGYQLQIEKLKKLNEMIMKAQQYNDNANRSYEQEKQQLRIKEKELELKNKKIEDKQNYLKQKQRAFEIRQAQFDKYRKNQEEKLQEEKKNIYKMQTQLQRKKIQLRKDHEEEKIHLTSDLAKQQLQIARQKEQIKIDRQELDVARELFQKQKLEYEQFNANIMRDYKNKFKQLQEEKHYYQQKQIELYKKIHTVEMMGNLKMAHNKNTKNKSQQDQQNHNKNEGNILTSGNHRNELKFTNNYTHSPPKSENISRQKYGNPLKHSVRKSSLWNASNANLKQYLLRVNRDNTRMRPFLP